MSRPARARELERRQRAEAIDRRIGRLTSTGMGGLLTAMDAARSKFIEAWRQSKSTRPAFDAMFTAMGVASLEASVVGHLTAAHDVHALAGLASRTRKATGFGPYENAVRIARERAEMTVEQVETLRRRYGVVALEIVQDVRQATTRRLEAAVEGIIRDNLHVDAGVERLEAAFDASGVTSRRRHQVEAIVRSQVQLAYSAGAVQADRDPAVDEILWGYKYSTVGDDRVRPTHEALDGVTLPKNNPRWQEIMPPNGWNCFLPGTLVSGAFRAGLEAPYSGPAVEIETARGGRLAVTANHPILTDKGWVRASEIREGDHCISSGGNAEHLLRRDVDDQQRPSRVEDVLDALRSQRGASTAVRMAVDLSPLDLYGDARFVKDEVRVVLPDGVLLPHQDAAGPQFPRKGVLVGSDSRESGRPRPGGTRELVQRFGASPAGLPRTGALALHRRAVSLQTVPLQAFGCGSPSWVDPMGLQHPADHGSSDADGVGDGLLRVPGQVSLHHRRGIDASTHVDGRSRRDVVVGAQEFDGRRDGHSESRRDRGSRLASIVGCEDRSGVRSEYVRRGLAADWHATADELAKQRSMGDPRLAGQLTERSAGLVAPDKVTKVRKFWYSGHVFDLEARGGWMVAGGIVASNCRCTVLRVFSTGVASERDFVSVPVPDFVTIDGERVVPGADEGWKFNPGDLFPGALAA